MNTIGIIGAMDEEVTLIKSAMNVKNTVEKAGCTFLSGTIEGKNAVVVRCGIGKVKDVYKRQLIGFKMAEKPADEDHPYGHARYEYLSGLTVAVMIILIGFELFKSSLNTVSYTHLLK